MRCNPFAALTLLLPLTASAADTPALEARRAAEAPVLDGVLDDACWTEADWYTGYTQRDPDPGAPSTELTRTAFVYDDKTLYVAFDCRDSEPAGIIARLSRRDTGVGTDDNVDIYLSPGGDGRLLYYFSTNPAGVKLDQLYTNRAQWASGQWDGHWDVATTRTAEGWSAEFALPFSNFQFDAGSGGDWIFNAGRVVRRKHEETYLAPLPYSANMFYTEYAATLSGIDGVADSLGLELTPYAKADYRDYPQLSGDDAQRLDALGGLVLDFDISRSLNLAGAVLPDYAEIDLDPDQYVIGRDQVYLSETRPFFLENANFFSTSYYTVFHSRRIGKRLFDSRGLYTDSEIIAGGRLTGKSGPVGYGAFYAHTGEAVTDLAAEPESDWGVLRLTHDLTPGGYLGLAGTTRLTRPVETAAGERLPGYDYASYALDFDLYFGDGGAWNLAGMAVGSFDGRNTDNAFADNHAVGAEVDYTGEVFDAGINYEHFTAGFDLDQTGYMWTSGFGLHNANLHGRLRFNLGSASLLRSFWIFGRANLNWDWGWAPAMQEYGLELSSMTNGGWLFGLESGYGRDWLFPETGFQDYHYFVPWFNTPYSGMISAHLHGLYGELIDFSTGAVGELVSGYLNLTLRPVSALSLSAELELYDWGFAEDAAGYAGETVEDYDVLIWTATANYLFTREFYLRLFSQGSSRNDIYTFRALAAWEYLPDSNLYLAYEQWREDTPAAFELINQGVFLKMDYLLQF